MYKILIVEDDAGILEGLSAKFTSWGFEAVGVKDFRNVTAEFVQYSPHLVIMDISLPFMNGYHWCNEIRRVSSVPIVFVSSASDNMNIVMAMNMGADDFIAKPFDGEVLIAKVQAILRRTYSFAQSVQVIEHRGAIFNLEDGSLVFNGARIELTKNEYRILAVLLKDKGKSVSREKLMEALWQTDCFVDDNTLTVNVGRLRKKLEAAGLEGFIETKHGVGYIVE